MKEPTLPEAINPDFTGASCAQPGCKGDLVCTDCHMTTGRFAAWDRPALEESAEEIEFLNEIDFTADEEAAMEDEREDGMHDYRKRPEWSGGKW